MQIDEIPYQIKLTRKAKRISLRINAKGLSIVSPRKLPDEFIQELLSKHYDWIIKNLPNQSDQFPELITILDRPYELILVLGEFPTKSSTTEALDPEIDWEISRILNSYICVSANQIVICSSNVNIARKSLHKWIAGNAKEVLIDRTLKLAREFGFEFNNVAIKDQITRWGSCSSQKNLNFNWRLVLAPKPVMEYVIIHELAHTKHMNHSDRFWTEVGRCMPDYAKYRAWLKSHTDELREI